jgi:hypothetical protein
MMKQLPNILATGAEGICHPDLWYDIAMKATKIWFVKATWVKGHSGNYYNERADKLAKEAKMSTGTNRFSELMQIDISQQKRVAVQGWPIDGSVPQLDEFIRAVRSLKRYRSPGPDGLMAETFKKNFELAYDEQKPDTPEESIRNARKFCQQWVELWQKCWECGELPLEWCAGTVIPIPKPGRPGEFRGITLVSVAWKVLSRILDFRLSTVPLLEMQHGFLAHRSTKQAILAHKAYIHNTRMAGRRLIAVYVDIKAAYDSVDRQQLMNVLRSVGAPDSIIDLLSFAYKHERLSLRTNRKCSPLFSPKAGVKQGDVA